MPRGLEPDCGGQGIGSAESVLVGEDPLVTAFGLHLAGVRDCQVAGLGNTPRSGEHDGYGLSCAITGGPEEVAELAGRIPSLLCSLQ